MYLKDDLNRILFKALKGADLAITGGVYIEDRPLNSKKEDIVINTITTSQSFPQYATSNINVFVPDKTIKVAGAPQYVQNAERIEAIVRDVIGTIEATREEGMGIYPDNYNTTEERTINQHCANVRVSWFICKKP